MKRWKSHATASMGRCTLIPVMAAVTLLAACGNDAGSAGGSAGAPAGGANLSGTPIVVGAMVNVSGPGNASDKAAADVLAAWAAHTNENGGIGGHPVEVRVEDTRGDAPTATTIAETFAADESVVAVMLASSSIEGAVAPVLAGADLAVSGMGYNPQVWGALPNFYTIGTQFPAVVNEQVASAVNVGARTMVSMACAENPNCASAEPVLVAAADAAGVRFAGTLKVAASAPNYTAECLRTVSEGVDFVQLSASEETSSRIVVDCQRQGYSGWFGASAGSVTPGLYAETPGIRLAGGINGFPWWLDTAPVKNYRQVMEDAGVSAETYGGSIATGTWAAAEMFRTALSGIGQNDQVSRASVLQAYGAVKDEDLDGLVPQPMTYAAGQPGPRVSCYWLYTYENSTFAGGDQPSCDQPANG
jgi:branched-chain amino acid transport system substrate-binding protein